MTTENAYLESHIIFYGDAATDEIARDIVTEIETMYNSAQAEMFVNGSYFNVVFRITYQLASEQWALELIKSNTNPKYLFIRIEDSKPVGTGISTNRSEMQLCDNAGFFVTTDNLGKSTTAAHEYGHSMGLLHPYGDQRGNGNPGIMAARGTLVDEQWRYDGWEKTGYLGIDPAKRTVTKNDIDLIINTLDFNKKGFADIGKSSNLFYNKDGSTIDTRSLA